MGYCAECLLNILLMAELNIFLKTIKTDFNKFLFLIVDKFSNFNRSEKIISKTYHKINKN